MMKKLVEEFPNHLRAALEIGRAAQLHACNKTIHNIVISGLGGSGIGGRIVGQLVAEKCSVPIVCTSDYVLPEFVGEHTLVIISSYSGDTEETVAAMQEAIAKKAEISNDELKQIFDWVSNGWEWHQTASSVLNLSASKQNTLE